MDNQEDMFVCGVSPDKTAVDKENAVVSKNDNLLGKEKKKILIDSSQSLFNPNTPSVSEGGRSYSFEKLITSMTTPCVDKGYDAVLQNEKHNSQIMQYATTNQNTRNSQQDIRIQNTFEEMMSELLTPELNISNKLKKRNDSQVRPDDANVSLDTEKEHEVSFEVLMDKMLSPHSNIQCEQNQDFISSQDFTLHSQVETNINNFKKRSSRPNKGVTLEFDTMSFEQVSISSYSANNDNHQIYRNTVRKLAPNINKPTPKEIALYFPSSIGNDDSPEIFEENVTTNDTRSKLKEMSTQTSFDNFSISVLTPFLKVVPSTSDAEIQCRLSPYTENLNCSQFSIHESENEVGDKRMRHILDILTRDITVLPGKVRIFNNISKIGTLEWLESALSIVRDNAQKYARMENVDIIETQNNFKMYVDYDVKIELKHYQMGNIKMCKINKNSRLVTYKQPKLNTTIDVVENLEHMDSHLVPKRLKLSQEIDEICKNQNLVSNQYCLQAIDKDKIKAKIHDIFEKLYDAFESNRIPRLVIINSKQAKHCIYEDGRLQAAHITRIHPKGRSGRKFCYLLYILAKIYNLLGNNNKLTKREIFYQIKRLAKRQIAIDAIVNDATCLLRIGHWHLNIITHSGLVYGNLKLFWASGEVTKCNAPATLIPNDLEDIVEVHSNASFILVVEKESIFHKLLEEDLPNKLSRPFIMLTGKGVPDINTRLFLNRISNMLSLSVFILVDADVYGIRIMLNYRFGSINCSHLSDHLAVPNARWLGVYPSEICSYGMTNQPLTPNDKRVIKTLLKHPFMESHPKIVDELTYLLNSCKKASIEGLIKNNTFLSETYLPMKFFHQDFV